MKNRLNYQTSEYDCGPTTILNAFRYLFQRDEILPELIKNISLYTLDVYDQTGELGKCGTSRTAMIFLSNWFNQFSSTKKFPLYTEILLEDRVNVKSNSKIIECLQQGGVAIICCWLGDYKHYVLLTDMDEDYVCMFDPYDCEEPVDGKNVIGVKDQPKKMNRKVRRDVINDDKDEGFYPLGSMVDREAMLLYNTNTRRTPEKTIEYFI